MKRIAALCLVTLVSACSQTSETQTLVPLIEQSKARHSEVLEDFAQTHEQFIAGTDRTVQEIEELVEKGESSELSEQEQSRLKMLSVEAEMEQERLHAISQRLASSTLDLIALTVAVREVCEIDPARTDVASRVEDFRVRHANSPQLNAQYDQLLLDYEKKLAGINKSVECAQFRTAEAELDELVVKTTALFAD